MLWGSLALWLKLQGPDALRALIAATFAVFGVAAFIAMFTSVRWRWLFAFSIALLAVNIWWNTLVPPSEGNWSPEVAQQVTGNIEGEVLTLQNVRAFEWRTSDDFTETWVSRTYDLSQIESVDLFMSYWGGPSMAHFMLSFGFADGRYLAWSNEVRREVGSSFSPVADFFKAHTISVIASEERDVVGLRSNIRKERVQIFRLKSLHENRRKLIEAYVEAANDVATKPHWFHSVFTNCSRSVIKLARHAGIKLPLDWRIIVNGYFPDYLYEKGAMNTDLSIEDLYRVGDIAERAAAVGLTDGYPEAIRVDVPTP